MKYYKLNLNNNRLKKRKQKIKDKSLKFNKDC